MSEQNVVSLKNFDQLLTEVSQPKTVKFRLAAEGPVFEIVIRALSDSQMAIANKYIDHVPPLVKRPGAEDDFDVYDAGHRKKMAEGHRLRRAFILDKGLVDLQVEGSDMAAKASKLEDAYPPRVLDFLLGEILKISTGNMEILNLANFISGGEAEASPQS